MADLAKTRESMTDFDGLMVFTDSGQVPPGAAVEQTNITSLVMGRLQVRRGYRPVLFDEEDE